MIPNETLDAVTNGRKGFHHNENGDFTGADGVDAMNLLKLHHLWAGLKLEIQTSMKMSSKVNTLKVANQMLGTKYRRKQQAFDHLEAVLTMAGELKQEN